MKVRHVYKGYPPTRGGIEYHLRSLTSALAHASDVDIRVLVVGPDSRTRRERDGAVSVTRAGRLMEIAQTPLSWRLCLEMARWAPDITHLHFPYPMGEMAYQWFGRSPRLVITYHSDIVRQRQLLRLYAPSLRKLLARADRIVTTSPTYARTSLSLHAHRKKLAIVPYGIDPSHVSPNGPDADPLGAITRNGAVVLFVGNFRYYKGLFHLLEAAQWIDATIRLVGEGPLEQRLRAHTRQLGVADRVEFMGGIDNERLPPLYRSADVFVLPSTERSEAFGIVQLEAMACGLPVVSTELGTGTSFANVHGQTGLVVPPRNPRALAGAINSLLANPPLRRRMGLAGRARVIQEFSQSQMAERTLAIYHALIDGAGQCARRWLESTPVNGRSISSVASESRLSTIRERDTIPKRSPTRSRTTPAPSMV